MNREPVLWGEPNSENLSYTDQDEAIEAILDEMDPPFPEKITIAGYARMEIPESYWSGSDPLAYMLERLDEEYGNPDGPDDPTQAMKDAEKAFLAVIREEYTPWACEEVCREEVVVADWIKENRPDWLEKKS